jgi:deoxyguanosine kinase
VNGDQDYLQLLEQICSIQSGRHYYNPLPVSEKK